MDYTKQHQWVWGCVPSPDMRAEIVEHVRSRTKFEAWAKVRLGYYTNELLLNTGPVHRFFPRIPALISIGNRILRYMDTWSKQNYCFDILNSFFSHIYKTFVDR